MLGKKELKEVVTIGMRLTSEKDKNKLFSNMVNSAMEIAECDAGTLYIYEKGELHFKIMKTLSQKVNRGENGEKIDIPPVPLVEQNVCAYAALHRELINIRDVYENTKFDFTGAKKYDSITGYRTGSMLTIPLEDGEDTLVGVLQLMNKMDENGHFISFTEDDEFAIRSLGSMAAVSLSNMIYIEEIKKMMHSFTRAFAMAVDKRTPYNGTHTRKVTLYAGLLADKINEKHDLGKTKDYFDINRKEQLILAATLHDIGKMIVPLSVMNKSTRLEERLDKITDRFQILSLLYERDALKGKITDDENTRMQVYLRDAYKFICEKNAVGFLPPEDEQRILEIAEHTYGDSSREIPFLTKEEEACLLIRKGTLTEDERKIMESHVVMTKNILEGVHFNKKYEKVLKFASTHHELLDGSGYPDHLSGDELELETRILAVVDVYDALTCTDRPYKKPMPREKAFGILYDMAKEGKMEERLIAYLEEAVSGYTQEELEQAADEMFGGQ